MSLLMQQPGCRDVMICFAARAFRAWFFRAAHRPRVLRQPHLARRLPKEIRHLARAQLLERLPFHRRDRDHHPFVRRAALVMLCRASVQDVRETVDDLVHDPDPSVARLAAHWLRHIRNQTFAIAAIQRLQATTVSDRTFIWQIPKLWLIRCNSFPDVIQSLRTCVERYSKSRSDKVQYHTRSLLRETQWVLTASTKA